MAAAFCSTQVTQQQGQDIPKALQKAVGGTVLIGADVSWHSSSKFRVHPWKHKPWKVLKLKMQWIADLPLVGAQLAQTH